MKKILLSMVLVGSLFGEELRVNSYSSDSESLSVIVENIAECYANVECGFHVLIDTDNDDSTGHYGSDYRITGYDGTIYAAKHTSADNTEWSWDEQNYLLKFPDTNIENNDIYIEFSDDGIPILNSLNTNFKVILFDNNWDESDVKEGTLNHNEEYHVFDDGGNDPLQLNPHQIDTIDRVINIFERTDSNNYGYDTGKFLNGDWYTRGATVGRIFVTWTNYQDFHDDPNNPDNQGSDAYQVIKKYENLGGNDYIIELAQRENNFFVFTNESMNNKEIEEVYNLDTIENTIVDKIRKRWIALGNDELFRQAQDFVYKQDVHDKAYNEAKRIGAKLPITLLFLADSFVLHGAGETYKSTEGMNNIALNNLGIEKINTYEQEIDFLNEISNVRYNYMTRDEADGAFKVAADRPFALQRLLNNNDAIKNLNINQIQWVDDLEDEIIVNYMVR